MPKNLIFLSIELLVTKCMTNGDSPRITLASCKYYVQADVNLTMSILLNSVSPTASTTPSCTSPTRRRPRSIRYREET
ncbi:hypothetical protein F4604DRAFT_1737879, partial [Suillus subluteus]